MAVALTDDVRALLDAPTFVTVGTINPDDSPQLSVMWVTRDSDDVLLSTLVGRRKERNLRRNPRIGILAVPPDNPYAYVEIRGTATMTPGEGRELIDQLSMKYNGTPYPQEPPEAVRVVIRVTVEHVVRRGTG